MKAIRKDWFRRRKGAGQYFTPREIIDLAVRIIKPQHGEIIQDPSLGTGGL